MSISSYTRKHSRLILGSENNLKMPISRSSIPFFLFCVLLVCSYSKQLQGQEQFSFRQLSVKEGLSQNSVVSIAQDSTGFLWLATQDGLNKYDGRQFTTYPFQFTDITRPTYSKLGSIYTDRTGVVWVIPDDHLVYSYDETKDSFNDVQGVTQASTVFQDSEGTHWFGTFNGEIHFMTKDGRVRELPLSLASGHSIYDISDLNENEVYVLTNRNLIQIDAKTKQTRIIAPKVLLGDALAADFSAMVKTNDERIWIGTFGDGLYFMKPGSQYMERVDPNEFEGYLPSNLNILDLYFDSKQRLWVTTYGSGLMMLDFKKKTVQQFKAEKNNPKALHYNDILCAYEDNSGTLWFGTDGAGTSYYDAYLEKFNSYTNYQTPENINIDVVRALTVDSESAIWIGTSGKGLTQFEPRYNSWTTYTSMNSDISSNRIMSLHYDADGALWIGTQGGGLSILDNQQFQTYHRTSAVSLPAMTIWTIFEDSRHRVWLGTRDEGLLQFHTSDGVLGSYQDFAVGDSLVSRKNIRVIIEDPHGNFWLGTDNQGLVKFNPNTGESEVFMTGADKNTISGNGIKSLFYDQDGVLWVGTSGKGLNALDITSGKFENYTTADGLSNNVIYGILPDEQGHLWLSSNKGITRFTPPEKGKGVPGIVNYDNYDALATEFNTGAYFKGEDGQLYFGGLEGLYWFNPKHISQSTFLPPTVITDFKVLNQDRSIHSDTLLAYDENTIDLSFSSLQFSEPEKNQYRYRLVPYEENWVTSGNKNFVRYTHLPPDAYEFQVISSNYDGQWNDSPERFNFTISAPWYFNTWSKIGYALLFILTGIVIYRYLKWRWKMQLDLQLKEEEAHRLKELNAYKSKIYTEIAHEFRTPLTLIAGPVESKLSEPGLSESDMSRFSMIERNTSRLTNLVDQLLQLAKLEEGEFELQKEWGDLGLFLKSTASSFAYEAKQQKVHYQYEVEDVPLAFYDQDALDKIVVNLISNALKYGRKEGRCEFSANLDTNVLYIRVENDTDGDIGDVQKLFERFYQKDKSSKGAGIGLSLVKELVKLYHGEIRVQQDNHRMVFNVKLPLTVKEPEINIGQANERGVVESTKDVPILLVVEDNADVRDFIATEFGKSYRILQAENGRKGVQIAFEEIPDIIISDVKMPVQDGIWLCNTLKTDERTSHIPIVLLTASTARKNELEGLKAGADDYVTKPFKIKILEKRVSNLISSRKLLRERYVQEGFVTPKEIAITPTDEAFLTKVQDIMDEHLADTEFNTAQFSRSIGMSRMQLHRKLMAYTGLSTSAFIRSQRLKQAVYILKTSDATINEVAYTVGFNTPSYFIKCFKETYKKTPMEYLQNSDN